MCFLPRAGGTRTSTFRLTKVFVTLSMWVYSTSSSRFFLSFSLFLVTSLSSTSSFCSCSYNNTAAVKAGLVGAASSPQSPRLIKATVLAKSQNANVPGRVQLQGSPAHLSSWCEPQHLQAAVTPAPAGHTWRPPESAAASLPSGACPPHTPIFISFVYNGNNI